MTQLLVSTVNENYYNRGSVLPFQIINGKIFYALGIDTNTGGLCDFGGGRETEDRSIIQTALRELSEESYNIFASSKTDHQSSHSITESDIQNCGYIFHGRNLCILLPVKIDILESQRLLEQLASKDLKSEMSSLIWFSRGQLFEVLDHNLFNIYPVTKMLLQFNKNYL